MVKYSPKKKEGASEEKKESEAKKVSQMYAKHPSKPGIKKKGY
jgi:hypothetical protein